MLDINDFNKKQFLLFAPSYGEKLSYKNDNIVIKDKDGKIKCQQTCYRIFCLIIIGDCSITTGLLRKSKKFGFSICFMTYTFRYISTLNNGLEGNTLLHKVQYTYDDLDIAENLILNKILNARTAINSLRNKSDIIKNEINYLDSNIDRLLSKDYYNVQELMGIEGNAARHYFRTIFDSVGWSRRKPQIKPDYINSCLDIGYTVLFGLIECMLRVYDFDVYKGVLHTEFYMRKSLVCDIMEPFRIIIDMFIKNGISLKQIKKDDFVYIDNKWQLKHAENLSGKYTMMFLNSLIPYKESIFKYVRAYYRAFVNRRDIGQFPIFDYANKKLIKRENL